MVFDFFSQFSGESVPLREFFNFGSSYGDTSLAGIDDGSTPAISLTTPIVFFGTVERSIYVSSAIIKAIAHLFKLPHTRN